MYFFAVLALFIFGFVAKATTRNGQATRKGRKGESAVQRELRKLDKASNFVFNDLIIPYQGGTTQTDHIVVNNNGVFVIETKHYQGDIKGQERDSSWTQSLGGKSFEFQNPLRQNYKHIICLEDFLRTDFNVFFNVVAFTAAPQLHTAAFGVNTTSTLVPFIKKQKLARLSDAQVQAIVKKLNHLKNRQTKSMEQAHVRNTQAGQKRATTRRQRTAQRPTTQRFATKAHKSCPCCNGNLTIRTARQGKNQGNQFLGCTNFPRCNHTAAA